MSINFNVNNNKKSAKDIFVGVSGAKRRVIKVLTSISGTKRVIYDYNSSGGLVGDFYLRFGKGYGSSSNGGSANIDIPFFKYIKSMRIRGSSVDADTNPYTFWVKYDTSTSYASLILFKTTSGNSVLDKTLNFTWGNNSLVIDVVNNPDNTATGGSGNMTLNNIDLEKLNSIYLAHTPNKAYTNYSVTLNFEVEYDFGE